MKRLTIIGGGLAGSEAAWQAAERGIDVDLFEMRPVKETGAHLTGNLAELVCSNSLGSALPDRASGLLKNEALLMGSLLLRLAREHAVPAGGCLAVDRIGFGGAVTRAIETHPRIRLIREEATAIPDGPAILASGPLTSPALADALAKLGGEEHLFFFDAIAPILAADSIDMTKAFRASRYGRGEQEEGDYINCMLDRAQYEHFVAELVKAERIPLESFEAQIDQGVKAGLHTFFEGCLPVEIIARRGPDSLAYGPMRPVGIRDPVTGKRPHAVLQLRQDNLAGTCYNMVGFQTNLRFPEQKRVFGLIPGLENAEFLRYGQMHRNTFVNAPQLLDATLRFRKRPDVFFAGQITGVEGYAGNIATGVLAGINAARQLRGESLLTLPVETMLGSLCHYVSHADARDFQPMKANFGLLPALDLSGKRTGKQERGALYAERSLRVLSELTHGAAQIQDRLFLQGGPSGPAAQPL
jgi:methylenetetrahydrofolate--tRNA-(uracil-5-)-methyltransferase